MATRNLFFSIADESLIRRIDESKHTINVVIGQGGSGKSYTMLEMLRTHQRACVVTANNSVYDVHSSSASELRDRMYPTVFKYFGYNVPVRNRLFIKHMRYVKWYDHFAAAQSFDDVLKIPEVEAAMRGMCADIFNNVFRIRRYGTIDAKWLQNSSMTYDENIENAMRHTKCLPPELLYRYILIDEAGRLPATDLITMIAHFEFVNRHFGLSDIPKVKIVLFGSYTQSRTINKDKEFRFGEESMLTMLNLLNPDDYFVKKMTYYRRSSKHDSRMKAILSVVNKLESGLSLSSSKIRDLAAMTSTDGERHRDTDDDIDDDDDDDNEDTDASGITRYSELISNILSGTDNVRPGMTSESVTIFARSKEDDDDDVTCAEEDDPVRGNRKKKRHHSESAESAHSAFLVARTHQSIIDHKNKLIETCPPSESGYVYDFVVFPTNIHAPYLESPNVQFASLFTNELYENPHWYPIEISEDVDKVFFDAICRASMKNRRMKRQQTSSSSAAAAAAAAAAADDDDDDDTDIATTTTGDDGSVNLKDYIAYRGVRRIYYGMLYKVTTSRSFLYVTRVFGRVRDFIRDLNKCTDISAALAINLYHKLVDLYTQVTLTVYHPPFSQDMIADRNIAYVKSVLRDITNRINHNPEFDTVQFVSEFSGPGCMVQIPHGATVIPRGMTKNRKGMRVSFGDTMHCLMFQKVASQREPKETYTNRGFIDTTGDLEDYVVTQIYYPIVWMVGTTQAYIQGESITHDFTMQVDQNMDCMSYIMTLTRPVESRFINFDFTFDDDYRIPKLDTRLIELTHKTDISQKSIGWL